MINKASKSLTRKTPSLAFALHCTKSRDRLSFLWNWIDAQCAYIFLLCLSIQVDLSREEASNLRILGRPDRLEIIDLPGCEIQNQVQEALFPFVPASYSLVSVADLWRALNLAWFVAAKNAEILGHGPDRDTSTQSGEVRCERQDQDTVKNNCHKPSLCVG